MAIDFTKQKTEKIPKDVLVNAGIAIASLVLFAVLWTFTVKPEKTKIENLNVKSKTMSSATDKKIATLQQDKIAADTVRNNLSKKIEPIKKRLTEEINVSLLMDRFAQNAREHKLTFNYIKPSSPEIIPVKENIKKGEQITPITFRMKKISVTLETKAGFFDFLNFLANTEYVDQFLKVTDFVMENNPENNFLHKERITLDVYQLLKNEDENKKL
ncbi:MAG: hypothetical protein WCY05_07145 [Candidatus Omnitrophota bacterium]